MQIHRDSVKLEPASKLTYTDSKNYFIKNKKGLFDIPGSYKLVISWKTIAAEKEISFFVKEVKEPKEEDKVES